MQVVQAALKGLQCCLSGGKWKFGGAEELGSVLASLKVKKKKRFAYFFIDLSSFVTYLTQTLHDS